LPPTSSTPRKLVLGPPKWTVEKGIVFDAAFPRGGVVWSPGAEFRGVLGSNRWSLVGAAGARGPVTLSLDHGVKAEVLRFPVDAGARLTGYRWRLRPWLVVGGTATLTGSWERSWFKRNANGGSISARSPWSARRSRCSDAWAARRRSPSAGSRARTSCRPFRSDGRRDTRLVVLSVSQLHARRRAERPAMTAKATAKA
jgi:hypothetical protein